MTASDRKRQTMQDRDIETGKCNLTAHIFEANFTGTVGRSVETGREYQMQYWVLDNMQSIDYGYRLNRDY